MAWPPAPFTRLSIATRHLDLGAVGGNGGVDQRVVGPDSVGQLGRPVQHPDEGTAAIRVPIPAGRDVRIAHAHRVPVRQVGVERQVDPRTNGPECVMSRAAASSRPIHRRQLWQDFRLVPMTQHRVGEQVVRPHGVMGRRARLHTRAAGARDREDGRREIEPGPSERIQRELSRGGKAAGSRDARALRGALPCDIGEAVA